MRPRLLPATIAVAALLLASKMVSLGLAFMPAGSGQYGRMLGVAVAATPDADPPPPPLRGIPAAKPPPEPAPPPAPVISESELHLLQDLRGRRQELDTREQVLQQREQVLDAAQQRVAARAGELTALQSRLEQLESQRHEHEEANWAGLVKVYEVMKPRDAAAILNDMDMPILIQVLDRMKEAKAAALLGAMQPDRARLATTQLAAMRTRAATLPDRSPPGG